MVECDYTNVSKVTGYQVIAQLSNPSEVHILYINKTTTRQTSVIVRIEEDGLYQIIVFSIRGKMGITESSVEYAVDMNVNIALKTTTSNSTGDFLNKQVNMISYCFCCNSQKVQIWLFQHKK